VDIQAAEHDRPADFPAGPLEIYPPSWVDRVAASVEGMRIPYWLLCLLLFTLEFLLIHVITWLDGSTPFPSLKIVFVNPPLWTWGSLALIIYLDRVAVEALQKFKPLLEVDNRAYQTLEFHLTTMPSRPIVITNILFVLFFLTFIYIVPIKVIDLFRGRGLTLLVISAAASFLFGSAFYYHTLHQLRIVRQIYDAALPLNLFDREPIFAFSKVTSTTSVAMMLFLLSNLVVAIPLQALDVGVIIFELIGTPLALAAFAMPLWGAHTRLTAQKRELQTAAELRMKAALQKLDAALNADDLTKMDQIQKTLNNLLTEREVIARLPTWPWRPGTVTGVASAILLPTVLLIIQTVIQRLIAP
jgi:hypothetical protein